MKMNVDESAEPYVSCIKIGKDPIIPPLMTNEIREEMRQYKKLAIAHENSRKKRSSIDSGVITNGTETGKYIEKSCTERKNSYTLEAPSPALLEYVQSLHDKTDMTDMSEFISIQSVHGKTNIPNMSEYASVQSLHDKTNMADMSEFMSIQSLHDKTDMTDIPEFLSTSTPKKSIRNNETDYMTYMYLKDQLEMRHREQLNELLKKQQSEHDILKQKFTQVLSSSQEIYASCYNNVNKYLFSPRKHCVGITDNEENFYYDEVLASSCDSESLKSHITNENIDKINALNISEKSRGYQEKITSSEINIYSRIYESDISKSPNIYKTTMKALSPKKNFGRLLGIDKETLENAVTKINAYVRGYLTRRLFQTERVKLLIRVIEDCLTTAFSLQNESNLDASGLELYDRLLQQCTVTHSELCDIFASPIEQRMAIIAADREKRNRQLNRVGPFPLSEGTKRRKCRIEKIKSAPPSQQTYTKKRNISKFSKSLDFRSLNNTPVNRRPITTIVSQKYAVSQPNRKPWR